MKRSRIATRVHRVTVKEREVYAMVEARDWGCMAPRLDPGVDACDGRLTRQHVKQGPGGPRRTEEAFLLMLCWHHHLDGWATSKAALERQRDHLRRLYPEAWSG